MKRLLVLGFLLSSFGLMAQDKVFTQISRAAGGETVTLSPYQQSRLLNVNLEALYAKVRLHGVTLEKTDGTYSYLSAQDIAYSANIRLENGKLFIHKNTSKDLSFRSDRGFFSKVKLTVESYGGSADLRVSLNSDGDIRDDLPTNGRDLIVISRLVLRLQKSLQRGMSPQKRRIVIRKLNELLAIIEDRAPQGPHYPGPRHDKYSDLICIKNNVGRYYPAKRADYKIMGSTSYNAGYDSLSECESSLPKRESFYACVKNNVGRFYISEASTFKTITSTSYNAGYDNMSSCSKDLPRNYQRVACYKNNHGRYYPSDAKSGKIIGSTSYNAGYDSKSSCDRFLNQ